WAAVAVAPASVPAATTTIAVPAAGRPTAVPGPDLRQLLGGLVSDLGVVGQAEPDAPALLVQLDHPHLHLVAAVDDSLDRLGSTARDEVRDVEQAVGALAELDERPERRGLDDLPGEHL